MRVSGLRYIVLDSKTLTAIRMKDIHIDPGAFGKGEALDRALELAQFKKMAPWMIDFGGQFMVHGIPEGEIVWRASIARPSDRLQTESETLYLESGSLSTSGFSERSGKVGNRKINHILDPVTGHPVKLFGSVTVWHPKALVADILSTALYVMGPGAGFQWALKNNIAALFIVESQKKEVLQTPEFQKLKVKS
jgi:thiamine biosynthesis lipoprotein